MASNFPFIVSNGPKLQADAQTRTLIRKQAMKDIGVARKQRGTYGKQGAARTVVSIRPSVSGDSSSTSSSRSSTTSPETSGSDSSSATKETDDTELVELFEQQLVQTQRRADCAKLLSFIQTPSILSDYEVARNRFGMDVADLTMLTNFNIGKSTVPILAADPVRLAGLLDERQWSYLEYVPSRYGASECLKAATDCLLAKVRSVLAPQSGYEALELRLYAKALQSVQKAISSHTDCRYSDVLCATQILSLRELLDPSRDSAWSHHVNGSIHLVKHRGTTSFKSDFEKALFAGHVGTVVSEALLANERCYLEEPEWTELYLDMEKASDFLTDRSALTLKVRLAMFSLPGLWHDVDVAVSGPLLFDDETTARLDVRCRKLHRDLLEWTEDYKAHCVRLSLANPTAKEIAMRRELFGTSMECLILVKRLLATVCDTDRPQLEVEVQALAHLILDLQKQPSPKHSWLFTGHEMGVTYTVGVTRDQWEEPAPEDEMDRKLAMRNRYILWSKLLRMVD